MSWKNLVARQKFSLEAHCSFSFSISLAQYLANPESNAEESLKRTKQERSHRESSVSMITMATIQLQLESPKFRIFRLDFIFWFLTTDLFLKSHKALKPPLGGGGILAEYAPFFELLLNVLSWFQIEPELRPAVLSQLPALHHDPPSLRTNPVFHVFLDHIYPVSSQTTPQLHHHYVIILQVLDQNPEFSTASALGFILNRLVTCTAPTGLEMRGV